MSKEGLLELVAATAVYLDPKADELFGMLSKRGSIPYEEAEEKLDENKLFVLCQAGYIRDVPIPWYRRLLNPFGEYRREIMLTEKGKEGIK